ncbi:TPA: YopX family protein [Streptococcus suis]
MIPKFRAWDKIRNRISEVERIYIDTKGVRLRDENGEYWRRFDDVILVQSTGLFDVNGKEIFEGDVVKFNDAWSEYDYEGYVDGASEGENFTEIIKTENGFSFGRTKIPESSVFYFLNDEHMKFSEIVKSDDFSMVIVGNIYENPELLEATND